MFLVKFEFIDIIKYKRWIEVQELILRSHPINLEFLNSFCWWLYGRLWLQALFGHCLQYFIVKAILHGCNNLQNNHHITLTEKLETQNRAQHAKNRIIQIKSIECWQKLLDFERFSFTPLDFFNIFFKLMIWILLN